MGDSAPLPSAPPRWSRILCYALATLVGAAFPVANYRLDAADLHAPLIYDADALLILPMVQATLEHGSHWKAERLGAPGIEMVHDFPVIDHFHFFWLWLLGQFLPDAVFIFNLYYFLTYPLTALLTLVVFRHFGLSLLGSTAGAILYALLPYHYFRGENHYFLSAYYLVPLTSMVILWVSRGQLPFFPSAARGRLRLFDRTTVVAVLLMLVTSAAGAYYAFFACGLFVGAGLYAWVAGRGWRAMVSAGLLIGVIVAGGLACHLPTILYQMENGRHPTPTERVPEEAEYYGLKLTQLLLPIDDHRIRVLSDMKSMYNSYLRPVQNVSERYTLGTVASIGFLVLLARLMLPWPRVWPYAHLGTLSLFAVLIGTVGGFGAGFNHLVTPQVRCYNRIAIYIAFFSLFAVIRAGDSLLRPFTERFRLGGWATTVVRALFWIAVTVVGVIDQTPYGWGARKTILGIAEQQKRFRTDEKFFQQIEATLNPEGTTPGPSVFQLPYVQWPESPPTERLNAYEHARGYLHTKTLRWSFGSMRGREVDEWYRQVAVLAPVAIAPMLDRVAKAGFSGLILDKRGYTPARAEQIQAQLMQVLGAGATQIMHPDGKQVFFDLRKHNADIRQGRNWELECYRELHPVTLLWLNGVISHEDPGYEWQQRWCKPRATVLFVNPTEETKTFVCTFRLITDIKEPSDMHIRGGDLWTEDLKIDKNSLPMTRTFVVPPGRHAVEFHCVPPASYVPTEPRRLLWGVVGLKLE